MLPSFIAAVGPTKVAVASIVTLVSAQATWVNMIFAQQDIAGGATATTIIPAAALTGTSGALVWVVKQIVSGNLVHRDPAAASAKLTDVVERNTAAIERAAEREQTLTDLLIEARRKNQTNDHG